MNTTYLVTHVTCLLFVLSLLQAVWFKVGATVATILGAIIFHKVKLNSLKAERGELQRKLDERSELLLYSGEKEKKSREEAEIANQSKSKLLVKISHEIRTPMNGVMGMASLLAETPLTNEQKEYTETIRSCGETLLSVINDILLEDVLAHSKVEGGKSGADQKEFDLCNSIEEVLEVFGTKAATSGIELLYQIANDVPHQIIGDSTRFRQVLMNLVENAIKFTEKGEVIVKVSLVTIKEGDTIELAVEIIDSGIGMSDDKVKQLTTDFSDMDACTEEHRVTGLGLVICKKLVGLMGGSLSVASQAGKGTTLKFQICALLSHQSSRIVAHKDWVGHEGKKVLVVDDNIHSGESIGIKLEHWKLAPTVVNSAEKALTLLAKAADFDLIITDMNMPGMNGVVFGREVEKLGLKIPMVLLVMEGDEAYRESAELFNSVITKPMRHHLLSKHILSGLRNKGKGIGEESTQVLSADFAKKYPLRILIAEDNRVNQKLAMRILTKLGYNPDIAQNGKEVLEEVSQVNYDVVLMDVQMPEMDGLEATRMMRLCLDVQPVIIAMTANTMQGDREECLQAGMDDYISKPIHLEELVIILEKWASHVNAK
jgi:signal transduction histidine kinase/CheY-like chemotaxis protein